MFKFVLCLCLCLDSHAVFTLESNAKSDVETQAISFSTNVTITESNQTKNASINQAPVMERFTQPLLYMDRSLQKTVTNDSDAANKTSTGSSFREFKPSPHLGTYYEHNSFPVKPALPEAKTFGSYYPTAWNDNQSIKPNNNPDSNPDRNPNIWTEKSSVPTWMEKQSIQNPWEQNVWTENPQQNVIPGKSIIDTGKVKFPNSEYDRPYQFISHEDNLPLFGYPVTTESFAFNKPVALPKNPQGPTQSFWGKLLGYNSVQNKAPELMQKTLYDYNLLEKPPHHSFYEFPKEHGYSVENYKPHSEFAVNPWKKVIKFLAAIIPIGLFISALTPTVITVSSANDTQSRYRNEDSKEQNIAKRLTSSLSYFDKLNYDGCEDKVLCELLVSASFSKNAERHIRNLLDNFIQQEDLQNKKGDLLNIFDAVKNQDCSPILCGNIKNPT